MINGAATHEATSTRAIETDILVSTCPNARDVSTYDFSATALIKKIRSGGKLRPQIEAIRQTFSFELATHGDYKRAKEAIGPAKERLPGITWSGQFTQRAGEKLVRHSGFLCADLDNLGDRLGDIRKKLSRSPHVWAMFVSPSGDGLKAVFRVPADLSKHAGSFRAVRRHVQELAGVEVDESCKDVARLCFWSYDPEILHNPDAIELEPEPEQERARPTNGADVDLSARQRVITGILGVVDWQSESAGFVNCPGKNLHSTGDKPQDCKVDLDRVPTLHCFHNSCRGIIDGINHQIRSQIGKAEHASSKAFAGSNQNGADHGTNGNGHAADMDAEHFVKASTVTPKKLRWLWHSRIPLGKVTVLDGDPGLGKSLLSIEIAACLSTGKPMPNAATAVLEPAGAVFLSAEDDTEDTIQPRLALAGADLDKIAVRKVGNLVMLTIADLDVIRGAVKLVDAKLVVIDPLMAFLPAETNSYRDQDIRRSLAPLAALAADLNVAILVIRHLNKTSNSNPIYRGGGSIGIIGAARSGLMVAKDPDDDSRCILSVAKSNLAKLPASLAYEIMSNAAEIPFINWLGTTQHTAVSLLHDQADSEEERSAVRDAEDFLTEYLKDMPRKAGDVLKARIPAGISEKTLRRAKIRLRIQSKKSDFQGEYFWSLPDNPMAANESNDGQHEVL